MKALECRYNAEGDKLTSCLSQLPVCTLATTDSELDVGSSSTTTSCADSGRGLSCEVHDEPVKTVAAPARGTEPSGRRPELLEPSGQRPELLEPSGRRPELLGRITITEPLGRGMETFGRGTELVERNMDTVGRGCVASAGRGKTIVTVEDTPIAQTAALDVHRQAQLPQLRSNVNVIGGAGKKQSCQ